MSITPIQNFVPSLLPRTEIDSTAMAPGSLVQKLQGVSPGDQLGAGQASGGVQPASFSNILQNAIGQVDGKMRDASVEQGKLLTGETTNLHQSVIAMQEASLSFSLMVEVRNKLVDSYQELMRMQV